MLPPQSRSEIDPVEAALRRLDPHLAIRWNPEAVIATPGRYDAYGRPIPALYDGRWEVVRDDGSSLLPGVVYQVKWDASDGHHDGDYRAVGWWLVDYMQRWDAERVGFAEDWARAWAEHDAADLAVEQLNEASARDFLDEQHFKLHGSWLIGRGVDFPDTAPQSAHDAPSVPGSLIITP